MALACYQALVLTLVCHVVSQAPSKREWQTQTTWGKNSG